LRRIAAAYGTEPRFVLASATIGNPGELAERLTGLDDVTVIDRDGSPGAKKTIAMWNPPVTDEDLQTRRSALAESADLLAGLVAAGLGVRLGVERHPDADGRTPWRIDPSIIATDVESDDSGKALGAARALALLAGDGPLPRVWHTVGDSRSDYAMADHLHALGFEVTHVDVGPRLPLTDRPYAVTTVPGLVHEAAGEAHLRFLAERLAP